MLIYSEKKAHGKVYKQTIIIFFSFSYFLFFLSYHRFSIAVQARVTLTRMTVEMKLARLSLCPFTPTSLEDLARIFGDHFYRVMSLSIDGQENLFCNYFQLPDGSGCIVFASIRMTAFLSHASQIYCDSSQTTPTPHFLVLSISAVHNGFIVPVLHCLFLQKSFLGYKSIINHLKRLNPRLSPETVVTGFDDDLAAAWVALFPTVTCLNRTSFHFIKSIMEAVKDLGLSSSFRNNAEVTSAVQACCIINMCPHEIMREALTCIVNKTSQLNVFNQLRPLYDYIWSFWLNGVRFANKEVSVCSNVECTMNTFEILHHMMRTEKVSIRGNIFLFIGGLASIEDTAVQDIQLLLRAQRPCRERKARSLATSNCVSDCTTDLSTGKIHVSEFIDKLSPCVQSLCRALL
ncbi:uncharacterized protein LOC117640238 [Thrips palmi]|uniref:Uncharacterized protein LOC117640238 n=1 Tax=Thrips palmi TaxID=161013 RepID=A0A6P8XZA7_THRPL|nr:uncharacterized protein LOC117640238 [Thrips palmi]